MPKLGKRKAALAALGQKSVFSRRDPVTGQDIPIARKPNTIATSARLIEFRGCMKDELGDFKATGATPKARAINMRKAFASAAKKCKK
jgi:hypothetical protein